MKRKSGVTRPFLANAQKAEEKRRQLTIRQRTGAAHFFISDAAGLNESNAIYMRLQDREAKSNSYTGGEAEVANGQNLSSQKGPAYVTASISSSDLNADYRNKPTIKSMGRSAIHELGHKAGLEHPWKPRSPKDIRTATHEYRNSYKLIPKDLRDKVLKNIMNSDANDVDKLRNSEGREITPGQIEKMKQIIEKEQNAVPNQTNMESSGN